MNCPKCEEECWRDDVDVGVGVIYGPYGCPRCGWSEDPQYDASEGESPKQKEYPDWMVDPFGGMIKKSAIQKKLGYFGIPKDVLDGPEEYNRGKE